MSSRQQWLVEGLTAAHQAEMARRAEEEAAQRQAAEQVETAAVDALRKIIPGAGARASEEDPT